MRVLLRQLRRVRALIDCRMAADQYVPTQYVPQPTPDLRNATVGPRGYKMRNKRKLDQLEEQVGTAGTHHHQGSSPHGAQVEQELNGMQDTSSGLVEDPVETQRKRFKHDLTGNGKVCENPNNAVFELSFAGVWATVEATRGAHTYHE